MPNARSLSARKTAFLVASTLQDGFCWRSR